MIRTALLAALLVGAGLLSTTAHATDGCPRPADGIHVTGAGKITGSPENDCLFGSDGPDRLWGGRDRDGLFAGAGDDVIHAVDSYDVGTHESERRDRIDGGAGWDVCYVNAPDVWTGCETVVQG